MNDSSTNLSIPAAIVIAGALIAGAVFYINRDTSTPTPSGQNDQASVDIPVAPVTEDDHILGNPNADIVIVEYSDTECPFCKRFHTTMQRIMDEYGKDGEVAWVYRHFPIEQLHSKAPREAEATECAAELGGNDGFWAFTDRLYELTPSNNRFDLDELPQIAEDVGLDRAAFTECLDSGRYAGKIEQAYEDARAAAQAAAKATGSNVGTPFSVMLVGDQKLPIFGAQPYTAMQGAIESILVQLKSGDDSVDVGPAL